MGRFYKVFLCLLLPALILISGRSVASIINFPNQKTGPFTPSTSVLVFKLEDDMFADPDFYTVAYRSVKDAVSLRVRDGVYIGYNFDYYVNLSLECYNSPSQGTPTIVTQTLQVSYNTAQGTTYQGVSTYNFAGYYRVDVKVTGAGPVTANGPAPGPGMVELTGNISVDRLLPFSTYAEIPMTASSLTSSPNQLYLSWTHVKGAEEYDVEWTTLDKGDQNENIVLALINNGDASLIAKAGDLFKNNASRTTTPVEKDTLSLSFNDDYLVARIRQVQYTTDGIRNTGSWCYKLASGYAAWDISNNWHSPNLNWQYSASYAEDGKKKEVTSYFDGTLRSRQTVTLSNTYKVPIVQESIFDSFGRPVVDILPSPVKVTGDPYLKYFPSYNLSNTTSLPYKYTDIVGTGCEVNPNALSTSSGSGRYYSTLNDFTADPKNKYIPDAEGYPFSVTQYTPDNTGRDAVQGGVGLAFQPGKTAPSHTTKYIYGKPDQWELDQLFGNDVGYAQHYSKNTVIDANNQISISYVNASGKTIATALAGAPPAGMDSLVSKVPKKFRTSRILQPADFVFDNSSMKFKATTTYAVTVTGPDTLKVNAEQLIYTFSQSSVNICSNCYFDLKFTVASACNAIAPVVDTIKVGKYATTCTANGGFVRSLAMNFTNLGEYYVTAELVLSKSVMEAYVANFITQGQAQGVVFKEWHFVRPYLDKIDFTGVLSDCSTAAKTLGTQADFSTMFKAKLTAGGIDLTQLSSTETTEFNTWLTNKYTTLYSAATANCNMSPCNDIQNIMLQDLRPGGQYALFDQNMAPLEAGTNVIAVNWRTAFPVLAATDSVYIAHSFTRADGSISSANDAAATLADLVTYWQNDWAMYFLQYHPEYCKLQFCMNNSSSYDWDAHVRQLTISAVTDVANIPGAPAGTQYSYTNAAWLLSIDPFFKTGAPGNSYLAAMQNDLNNYSQTVLGYSKSTKSLVQYIDYFLYCSGNCKGTDTQSNNCWDNCSATTCRVPYRDWEAYKNYYLELKDKYYKQARNATTCNSGCAVGQYDNGNGSANTCPGLYDFALTATSAADMQQAGPCSSGTKSITLTSLKGNLSDQCTVYLSTQIAYSSLVPSSLTVFPNTNKVFFCIGNDVPLSAVRIREVDCSTLPPSTYIPPNDIDPNAIQRPSPGNYTIPAGQQGDQSFNGTPNYYDPVTNTTGELIQGGLYFGQCTLNNTVYIVAGNWDNYHVHFTDSLIYKVTVNSRTQTCTVYIPNPGSNPGFGIYTRVTPCPLDTIPSGGLSRCAALANKLSRFDFTDQKNTYPTDTTTAIAQNNAELLNQIQSSCEGHAERWLALLDSGLHPPGVSPAPFTDTQITNLKSALIAFCSHNGDKDHPYGASTTVKANTSVATNPDYPYTSFGDIIKAKLNITAFTDKLNPWLFDGPNPYDKAMQAAPMIVSNSNAQIAAKITQLQADYTAAGSPGGSFYNYLVSKYGAASMAQTPAGDLAILQNASASCNYILSKDIVVPVFMQPGTTGYITGGSFDSALGVLTGQISGVASSTNYNVILANFMNQRFGFSLSYTAWADFAASHTATSILTNLPAYQDGVTDPYAPIKSQIAVAAANGKHEYDVYLVDQQNTFRSNYMSTCLGTKVSVDNVAQSQNYHYTLYYYDQADNLVRTIPPEGVTLLTDAQIAQVQQIRAGGDAAVCATGYTGPTVDALKNTTILNTTFTNLGNTLSSGQTGAIEMWLYNTDNNGNQFAKTSTDGQYLFQLGIKANTLSVDVYSQPSFGSWAKVNRITVNTSPVPALQAWTHVVVQSNNFLSGEMTVFVNGVRAPVLNNPLPVVYPQKLTTVKHLRIYNRLLYPEEVMNNATNNCFMPLNTDAYWARFNIPAAGTETTVSTTSTQETKLNGIYPAHLIPTSYTYNATNQVVQQNSPDGGNNRYWYDMLSRLVASQNDKQQPGKNFSYTTYDVLGRITEVGQKYSPNPGFGDPDYLDSATVANFTAQTNNIQITHTYYDVANGLRPDLVQNNLRKRVSASTYRDTQTGAVQQASYYNYDLDGNVSTLWQQVNGLGTKQIDYEYDLVSGKVNFVRYQDVPGQKDKFYYKYLYDSDNRITRAYSGTMAMVNNISGSDLLPENARLDASYYYYLHGPLARMELGDLNGKVQGLDYAYTLQGWLKGINNQGTALSTDIGQDGLVAGSNPHQTVARDAIAYSLGYYKDATTLFNDYKPVGSSGSTAFALQYNTAGTDKAGQNLWNGNISNSTVAISQFNSGTPVGYTYHYDQLNRLKTYIQHTGISGTSWDASSRSENYKELITYDGNGNILTYRRNGTLAAPSPTAQIMDELRYNYNRDINGKLKNNRLVYIQDTIATGASGYTGDLNTQVGNNYNYDAIGNTIRDTQADITNVDWNVYGKITTLYKSSGNIVFTYDAGGNRVSKKTGTGPTSYYVRDEQGNTLATYSYDGTTTTWKEQYLYGSGRLGMWAPNLNVTTGNTSDPDKEYGILGRKYYELNNHLGNVLATISDKRLQVNGNTTPLFTADVITAQDYYPFGMLQPGRQYTSAAGNYRYGFNGKENDNDAGKGVGGEQDYGMRIYDPRVGRFLSTDPLKGSYPELTPYQFASDSPIENIDYDGLEARKSSMSYIAQGIKEGWNETKSNFKETFSKQNLKAQGKNAVTTVKTIFAMVKGDPNAAQAYGQMWVNFGNNVSNTAQYYTVKPILWIETIPGRSRAENLRGLGYGLYKGIELYATTAVPELTEALDADAILSKMESYKVGAYEGNDIIRGVYRDNVKFIIAQTPDDLYYLNRVMNAKATYMEGVLGSDNPGSILISARATRAEILEEAIHHQQRVYYGGEYFKANRLQMEIQAQDKLLEIGKRENWSKADMDEIREAKKHWESELKNQ